MQAGRRTDTVAHDLGQSISMIKMLALVVVHVWHARRCQLLRPDEATKAERVARLPDVIHRPGDVCKEPVKHVEERRMGRIERPFAHA